MSAEDPMHSSQGAPGDDGQRILATGSDIADLAAQVPRTLAAILGTWVDVVALVLEDVFQDERDNIDPGSKDGRKRPWDLCRKVSNIGARCQDALAIVSRRPLRRVHRIFSRHLTMVHD